MLRLSPLAMLKYFLMTKMGMHYKIRHLYMRGAERVYVPKWKLG